MSVIPNFLSTFRNALRMMAARDYNVDAYTTTQNFEEFSPADFRTQYFNNSNLQALCERDQVKMLIAQRRKVYSATDRAMLTTYLSRPRVDGSGHDMTILYFSSISETDSANINDVLEFVAVMEHFKEYVTSGIMITQHPLAPRAKSRFAEVAQIHNIQHFTDKELEFDPTAHVYNALSYHIMTMEERRALFVQDDAQSKSGPPGIIPTASISGESKGVSRAGPHIKESQLPRVLTDETVIKYIGARAGDVVRIINETFVPENLADQEIIYRKVRVPNEKPTSRSKAKATKPK